KNPSSKESNLFSEVVDQQKDMLELLSLLKKYKGCNEEIREAISKPSEESNLRVWKALQPSITTSTRLYKYSKVL
ncbi:Protein fam49b, partial [Massospora cicadina]